MPWKETDPMNERVQFIAAYLTEVYSMTELCQQVWHALHDGHRQGLCSLLLSPLQLRTALDGQLSQLPLSSLFIAGRLVHVRLLQTVQPTPSAS